MSAHLLHCPGCGAAADPESAACAYCRAPLATIACGACFGRVFAGARHCAHCGARVEHGEAPGADGARPCPRGCAGLAERRVGAVTLAVCPGCAGAWLDAATFERLCADREQRSALLGPAPHAAPGPAADAVRYRPCPDCRRLMNRVNFARISGVIVDVCRPHGVWLDADELRRLVAFVDRGGVDVARARERAALAEERRRLEAARQGGPFAAPPRAAGPDAGSDADGVLAAFLARLVS